MTSKADSPTAEVDSWDAIEVTSAQIPSQSNKSFEQLGLSTFLAKQCSSMGVQHPAPVQSACIPKTLEGSNILACAPTGSGKTAAFVLPMLEQLSRDPFGIFALILTPTRELAMQICDQVRAFGHPLGIRDALIVGGMDMTQQSVLLSQSPHIVVATPGRIVEHLRWTTSFNLKNIRFLVLDEADRLLENSFQEDLGFIFDLINPVRQTLLFSATITPNLTALEQMMQGSLFKYKQVVDEEGARNCKQQYCFMPEMVKDQYLVYLLQQCLDSTAEAGSGKATAKHRSQAIVFVRSRRTCELLHATLTELGVHNVHLHSSLPQHRRNNNIVKFKSGLSSILVATDVASRGLDIPQVLLVVNYDLPRTPEDYTHRIGRTARAGRGGKAISLVTQFDVAKFQRIEETLAVKCEEFDVPDDKIVDNMKAVKAAARVALMKLSDSGVLDKLPSGAPQKQSRAKGKRKRDGGKAKAGVGDARKARKGK